MIVDVKIEIELGTMTGRRIVVGGEFSLISRETVPQRFFSIALMNIHVLSRDCIAQMRDRVKKLKMPCDRGNDIFSINAIVAK